MSKDMFDWGEDPKPKADIVEVDDSSGEPDKADKGSTDKVAEMMKWLKATGVEDPGALYKAIKLVVENSK